MSAEIEEAFLEAIAANPDDDDARAIYADWLEERGDPRGEWLRLEMQLYRMPPRLAELASMISPAWLRAVARRYGVRITACGPNQLAVIKQLRAVGGFGLQRAKAIADAVTESAPYVVPLGEDRGAAERVAARFVAAGATASVVPHGAGVPGLAYESEIVLVAIASDRKLEVMKHLRELTGLGLAEVRAVVDRVLAGERVAIARGDASRASELAARFGGAATIVLERWYVRLPR